MVLRRSQVTSVASIRGFMLDMRSVKHFHCTCAMLIAPNISGFAYLGTYQGNQPITKRKQTYGDD